MRTLGRSERRPRARGGGGRRARGGRRRVEDADAALSADAAVGVSVGVLSRGGEPRELEPCCASSTARSCSIRSGRRRWRAGQRRRVRDLTALHREVGWGATARFTDEWLYEGAERYVGDEAMAERLKRQPGGGSHRRGGCSSAQACGRARASAAVEAERAVRGGGGRGRAGHMTHDREGAQVGHLYELFTNFDVSSTV